MSQHNLTPRLRYLLDLSQSMNNTNNMIWPLCKFISGRTRGEHALEICRTCRRLLPDYDHRYFISFQGDPDEYVEQSLTLEQIENKYRNQSRPRYRSNIVQRLHNVLQIMKNEAQIHSNSPSRLLIFSDGADNKSTQALKDLHRQTMNELRSLGISIAIINFRSIGLAFPDADHYISDDFPFGNMDQQIANILQQNFSRSTRNNTISNPSSNSSRTSSQANIHTLHDNELNVEEEIQYQYNPVYVFTS